MKIKLNHFKLLGWLFFWFNMVIVIAILLGDTKLEWTTMNLQYVIMMILGFLSSIALSIELVEE